MAREGSGSLSLILSDGAWSLSLMLTDASVTDGAGCGPMSRHSDGADASTVPAGIDRLARIKPAVRGHHSAKFVPDSNPNSMELTLESEPPRACVSSLAEEGAHRATIRGEPEAHLDRDVRRRVGFLPRRVVGDRIRVGVEIERPDLRRRIRQLQRHFAPIGDLVELGAGEQNLAIAVERAPLPRTEPALAVIGGGAPIAVLDHQLELVRVRGERRARRQAELHGERHLRVGAVGEVGRADEFPPTRKPSTPLMMRTMTANGREIRVGAGIGGCSRTAAAAPGAGAGVFSRLIPIQTNSSTPAMKPRAPPIGPMLSTAAMAMPPSRSRPPNAITRDARPAQPASMPRTPVKKPTMMRMEKRTWCGEPERFPRCEQCLVVSRVARREGSNQRGDASRPLFCRASACCRRDAPSFSRRSWATKRGAEAMRMESAGRAASLWRWRSHCSWRTRGAISRTSCAPVSAPWTKTRILAPSALAGRCC